MKSGLISLFLINFLLSFLCKQEVHGQENNDASQDQFVFELGNDYSAMLLDSLSKSNDKTKQFTVGFKSNNLYQIQFEIVPGENFQLKPIDFSDKLCTFALTYPNEKGVLCIQTYNQIIEPGARITINRENLEVAIILRARSVISGCEKQTQIRNILYDPNMPVIYHNSDSDCLFRIENNEKSRLLSLSIIEFPFAESQMCHTVLNIAGTNNILDFSGKVVQALFTNNETVNKFNMPLFLAYKYSLIRIANCYENSKPIELKVESMKRNSRSNPINILKGEIDSSQLLKSSEDSSFIYEFRDLKRSDNVRFFLKKFGAGSRCTEGKLIIYGLDERNKLKWYSHSCNSIALPSRPVEFKGFSTLFVQFTRSSRTLENTLIRYEIDNLSKAIVRKYSQATGAFVSKHYKTIDLVNNRLEVDIETKLGTQVVLDLNEFDYTGNGIFGQSDAVTDYNACTWNGYEACDDYCANFVMVNIDKDTTRMGSVHKNKDEEEKICYQVNYNKPVRFVSFTNRMKLIFSFSSQSKIPRVDFNYSSQPICNNHVSKTSTGLIKLHSEKSFSTEQNQLIATGRQACMNKIEAEKGMRIVFYKQDWKLDENGYLLNDEYSDTIGNSAKCDTQDSIIFTDQLSKKKKHTDSFHEETFNQFCMENPLAALVSKENSMYFLYKPSESNKNRSLVFEIGYFAYKSIYDSESGQFSIDFSKIIPKSKSSLLNYKVDLDIRVKAIPDKYLSLTVSNYNTTVSQGLISIVADKQSYAFKAVGDSFSTFGYLKEELKFEFRNVYLSELRDNVVRFEVKYDANLPRVMRKLTGTFESLPNPINSIQLRRKQEEVMYEWRIELEPTHFIRLNIDELKLKENILDLSIVDANTGDNLYDINQLRDPATMLRKLNFLFSTNMLIVRLRYLLIEKEVPYLKCSYVGEPRVIQAKSGELSMNGVQVKQTLDWLIQTEKKNFIIVKLAAYQGKGQLVFSLLNDGYKPSGTHHFSLNQTEVSMSKMRTTIMVSKENQLRIVYMPSTDSELDSFRLSYSAYSKVNKNSSDLIVPYINDLAENIIQTPRSTDQYWNIRAPYGKRIKVYGVFIDLIEEETCTKAFLNFYEGFKKDKLLLKKCGRFENDFLKSNLGSSQLLETNSNELSIQFVTHDSNEVSHWNSANIKDSTITEYKGFELVYVFVEEKGDCYFQIKENIACNYTRIGPITWSIKQVFQSTKKRNLSAKICMNCYLSATIPNQQDTGLPSRDDLNAILVSPAINPTKEYLKFDYRLTQTARLLARFVLDADYIPNSLDNSVELIRLSQIDFEWHTEYLKIGKVFQEFRIIFVLEKNGKNESSITNVLPSASLDNIQFFENNFECEDCYWREEKTNSCKKKQSACYKNSCAYGSLCVNKNDNEGIYECICGYGYTGRFCENRIDPCSSKLYNECSNNSKCESMHEISGITDLDEKSIDNTYSKHMLYTCKCDKNYIGHYCDEKLEPCKEAQDPCNRSKYQGVCMDIATEDEPKKYKCNCMPEYEGDECEIKRVLSCTDNQCVKYDKNATCVEAGNKFVCQCSSGYEGEFCTPIDYCLQSENVCLHNGTCATGLTSFQCKCQAGYTGKYCETSLICEQCDKEGTVYCDHTLAECVCNATHTGKLCEIPTDPCLRNTCLHGKCFSNLVDKFHCVCDDGYTGPFCEEEETACSKIFCQNGGICNESSTGKAFCECKSNFYGDNCENFLNPCDSEPCQNGATCYGYQNSYKCGCYGGFTGKNCEIHINNCENGKHMCFDGSSCISLFETYICICPPGRVNRYCDEKVDLCLNNKCQNGKCIENESGLDYKCECYDGYEGKFCETRINKCSAQPCFNGGECIDIGSKHQCKCSQPFRSIDCQYEVKYTSLPSTQCVANNTRVPFSYPGGSKCDCMPRYTGQKCDIELDVCEYEKPCRSGKCVSLGNGDYKCENCTPGYGGKRCTELIDMCKTKNPCENDAECLTKVNDFFCKCKDGFTGKTCSDVIDIKCFKHKCQHNAACEPLSGENGYKCICDAKHEGIYCEKKIDLCKNVTCNYGYCVDGVCECDPKFPYCKKNSKCNNFKCDNGGTCVDVISNEETLPKCLCPTGLTGTKCEISVYCDKYGSELCGDIQNCKTFNKNYVCDCKKPFIGHGCQNNLTQTFPPYLMQLKEEKLIQKRETCRFGLSNQSRLFLAIVLVFLLAFTIIGFLIGHHLVTKYKKKLNENENKKSISSSTNSSSELFGRGLLNKELTKPVLNKDEIYPKSNFSIPRPSIRLERENL